MKYTNAEEVDIPGINLLRYLRCMYSASCCRNQCLKMISEEHLESKVGLKITGIESDSNTLSANTRNSPNSSRTAHWVTFFKWRTRVIAENWFLLLIVWEIWQYYKLTSRIVTITDPNPFSTTYSNKKTTIMCICHELWELAWIFFKESHWKARSKWHRQLREPIQPIQDWEQSWIEEPWMCRHWDFQFQTPCSIPARLFAIPALLPICVSIPPSTR